MRDKHPHINWALIARGSKMTQREKYSWVRDGGKQVSSSHDPEFGQTTVKMVKNHGSKMTQRGKYSRVRDGGKQVADSHDPEFGINLSTNRDVVWKNQATCPRPKACVH